MKPTHFLILSFSLLIVLLFAQSPNAYFFKDSLLSKEISAPAEKVWPFLEDFCNLYKVFPADVSFCVSGTPNEPGLVRYMAIKGPPPLGGTETMILYEQHELIAIDQNKRWLHFNATSNNRLLKYWEPTMEVQEKGINACQIKWAYLIDPGQAFTELTIKDSLSRILDHIVTALHTEFGVITS